MNHATPVQVLLERPLTRETIAGLKLRALRRRVWYGALDRVERGLVDLTIRWVDKVRSGTMTRVLLRILGKLARAMEHGMARVLLTGRELALQASLLAVGWGNSQAYAWRFDEGFQRALELWRALGRPGGSR